MRCWAERSPFPDDSAGPIGIWADEVFMEAGEVRTSDDGVAGSTGAFRRSRARGSELF